MKEGFKSLYVSLLLLLFSIVSYAQSGSMEWVLLQPGENPQGSCTSESECSETVKKLCYGLKYTPGYTGIATSYTTGFLSPCPKTQLVYNFTCTMTDNSGINAAACDENTPFLFNSSGNTGSLSVTKDVPVVLHMICLEITDGTTFTIAEETVTNLTVSIDRPAGSDPLFVTDEPTYGTKSITESTDCALLPVELTSFDVEKSGDKSLLTWSTASEINNDYFNVERSTDGRNFETIGRVEGNGTTTERMTYSFVDQNPKAGMNYYRLKQVDYDGAYEYSQIKSVRFDSNIATNVTMGLYPNPANDQVTIELDGIKLDAKTTVRVFDKIGKLVLVQEVSQNATLDISQLFDGMYMVQAISEDSVIATSKLVKTSSY